MGHKKKLEKDTMPISSAAKVNGPLPGDPLLRMSAGTLAQRLRAGEISSLEVTKAHIRRIEEINPKYNVMTVDRFEKAVLEAKAADKKRMHGEKLPALHGVPITVKECLDVELMATTLGVTARREHRAAMDCEIVRRLRRAGAIILGKTNMAQLSAFYDTVNPVYGRTVNPWDAARTPAGSSGGEAAIIALGGSPLGIGTDLGGSVRLPAHFCGIHAFKPTSGRLPMAGTGNVFDWQSMISDNVGPMARSVEDLWLAMTALSCHGDTQARAFGKGSSLTKQARIKGMRIGFYTNDGINHGSPAVTRAIEEAAQALRQHGARTVEFRPPDMRHALCLYSNIIFSDRGENFIKIVGSGELDKKLSRLVYALNSPFRRMQLLGGALRLIRQKRSADALELLNNTKKQSGEELMAELDRYVRAFDAALLGEQLDLVLGPVCPLPAMRQEHDDRLASFTANTVVCNLLGVPAGAVSITRVRAGEESDRASSIDWVERDARFTEKDSAGLPIAVQLIGRRWQDEKVLGGMAVLESTFAKNHDYPLGA